MIPTSGLTGAGLDDLMEGLILQSEVMDLRADDEAHAEGIVMDARIEKGLGVVADCIVRWGSIEKGDFIVSGSQASRVRMLKDGKLNAAPVFLQQLALTLSTHNIPFSKRCNVETRSSIPAGTDHWF